MYYSFRLQNSHVSEAWASRSLHRLQVAVVIRVPFHATQLQEDRSWKWYWEKGRIGLKGPRSQTYRPFLCFFKLARHLVKASHLQPAGGSWHTRAKRWDVCSLWSLNPFSLSETSSSLAHSATVFVTCLHIYSLSLRAVCCYAGYRQDDNEELEVPNAKLSMHIYTRTCVYIYIYMYT